ncbi:unnamed protein product [Urochloa decumbens]|uniref:Uncharacterized protein n=1 Tax=Urochloa decumbens TaxID=240449 RepID=A0ABC8XG41_9POAL
MSPSFAGVSFVGDSSLSPSALVALPMAMSGYHVLVVNGYSRTKDTANGKCIRSKDFKIGGLRWFIAYYPNGYEEEDTSDMSFYLVLFEVNNIDPVTVYYTFSFLGQSQTVDLSLLVGAKCQHRDAAASTRFVVPPSDIQNHLYNLLQSQEGTDVTFQVGGEKFAAHRCVFAARSAAFKAQLFGPMKEGTTDTVVRIDDMEAKVFRLLLGYIYCDSVPEVDEELMLQHLLVAADKYDLPRLRLICEYKLCLCINADTVGTILELAEQHHCQGLKEACLYFLNSPANLQQVITEAGGLDNLTSSSSSVLTELVAKLASSLKFDK